MAETLDVPGAGKFKKQYVYAGVAVVGVLAIMYYRNHNASGTSLAPALDTSTLTGSTAYPSDGSVGNSSDPYSLDPTTGATYGSEGFGGGGTGGFFGGSSSTVSPNSGPGTFTDNANWEQYAINYLVSSVGMDAGTVSAALGAYINGLAVTAAQQQVINQAIGIAGRPPVAGQGNFPPSIRLQGSSQGSAPPPPLAAPSGFSVTPHPGFADFGWGKVSGATVYELVVTGAGGKGTGTSHVDHVSADNHAEHINLAQGSYTAKVRAGSSSTSITGKWTPSRTLIVPAVKK